MKYKDCLNKEDYEIISIFELNDDSFVCTKCGDIFNTSKSYNKKGTNCIECHKFERKCHHYKNPEYARKQVSIYAKKNRKAKSNYFLNYSTERKKIDPLYKLITNIRVRTKMAFNVKNIKKENSITKALGNLELAKQHLESLFQPGMTWKNHGEWHIDHVIPLNSANTEEELLKLTHYTNLQPLWAVDNLKKGSKV